jgi:hypothetical protein
MSAKARACNTAEIEHVRKFVAYAKLRVNSAQYYRKRPTVAAWTGV